MRDNKSMAEWMCELMCGTEEEAMVENIIDYANYLIDHKCSLRQLALMFDVPRARMQRYLTEDLQYIDDDLFIRCKNILDKRRRGKRS